MKKSDANSSKYEGYQGKVPAFKLDSRDLCTDHAVVMALGGVTLMQGLFVHTKLRLDFLKRAIKIMEEMGLDCADLVFADDFPLIVGTLNEKRDHISGVIVAPIVK